MNTDFLDAARVAAYLERVGLPGGGPPDGERLNLLHREHQRTVPFENLSIHLGEDIRLDPEALVAKVVDRRRGGFCYELNGAFAALLTALGYRVTLLAARIHGERGFGPPLDHLALRVDTDRPLLVDVGAARFADFPLSLEDRSEQHDPGGVFQLREAPDGDLDLYRDGEPHYRLEPRPRTLTDFEMACWWQRTSPDSDFTRAPMCSLRTADGRVTLSGNRLTRTDHLGRRTEDLPDEAAVLAAYRTYFGVELTHAPPPGRREDGVSVPAPPPPARR
ncbi:arylamine N-acetyltransferase [Streptomyces xiamenensis]|uniref:arylamine N-acetyltransferase family protein n=1 Tax=Streptomyces xiamenensis TaxID=408015 RepID=UPI0036E120CD